MRSSAKVHVIRWSSSRSGAGHYQPTLCGRLVNPGNACLTLASADNLGPVCSTCRKRYMPLPVRPEGRAS